MPFIAQVAVGRRERLQVFGGDYETTDGTGVRDYIHILDLVSGHLEALKHLRSQEALLTVNLGTGQGVSVLQLVQAFERVNGVRIPYEIVARRPGDHAANWADPSLANRLLGWRASRGVDAMCADSWNWQRRNPRGYEVEPL